MVDQLPIRLGSDGTTIRTVNVKKEEKIICKSIYVINFLSEDHDGLLNNVEITLIDETDPSDPERREEFWRTKLRTLAPMGLNIISYSFII